MGSLFPILRRRRLSSVQVGVMERSSLAEEAALSRLKPGREGEGWIVIGILSVVALAGGAEYQF